MYKINVAFLPSVLIFEIVIWHLIYDLCVCLYLFIYFSISLCVWKIFSEKIIFYMSEKIMNIDHYKHQSLLKQVFTRGSAKRI